MPYVKKSNLRDAIANRSALLNCISEYYNGLIQTLNPDTFRNDTWAKDDYRLNREKYSCYEGKWTSKTPLRSEFERRQALIEIDVLTAMILGLTLNDLITIYEVQFPTLMKNEVDTWYDKNGNIVFTCNPNLPGVGFSRKEWENGIKGAPAGQKFYRTINDDTMPGGPVERTIEYVAPFDRCDREQDYETAWKFFEGKYGKKD